MTTSDAYNSRLQPTELQLLQGATKLGDLQYAYTGAGCQSANNGNVCAITDVLNANKTQSFTYDQLNRIATGVESDQGFNQTYTYDAWGNMSYGAPGMSFSPSNQVSGYCYDAAGNTLDQGACANPHQYTWDAEGRLKQYGTTSPAVYTYDASGSRVRKDFGGGFTEYLYFAGNVIGENSGSGWTDYIFADEKRIAQAATLQASSTQYYWADHLGSTHSTMDSAGNLQCAATYSPFGSEIYACGSHYKFTGKERDSESGNDYFGARYYGSNLGRWMSPDWSEAPVPVPYANLRDPQTLNLYGFVENAPLDRVDADGHNFATPGSPGQPEENSEENNDQQQTQQAQNTTTAAAATSSTTMEEIDAVVKPLVDSAIGASEKAATVSLDAIGGVVLFVFASSQKTADEAHDTIHWGPSEKKDSAEPAAAAGGAGKGVKGGKKDRSGQGNIDQLEGLQNTQKNITKAGGYRISDKKSKQNIDNANKRIKSSEDLENQ